MGCWSCGLEGVADTLGIASWQLLDDPRRWLAPHSSGQTARRERRAAAPPSDEQAAGWAAALLADRVALRRLRRERGLTLATVRGFEVGWDRLRAGYTLPIRDERGVLVNLSWRAPKGRSLCLPAGPRKMTRLQVGVADGGLPLYPMPLPPRVGLLVEGEWDALIARQAGLPAFTGLLGKQWNEGWDGYAAGRRIAVAYDVGAEDAAAATVERLRAAGAREAWAVPLELPEHGDDLVDWFSKYGRSASELRRLIRRARSGYR